ncbi:hypothetical protein Tco_0707294 [Tanacetum coccineum]|uniref:Uncharacterized protein n=1 Tax=Tanacetum coccineum TaxID=301880 RepID=A0ABQ4YBE1_9ASTR
MEMEIPTVPVLVKCNKMGSSQDDVRICLGDDSESSRSQSKDKPTVNFLNDLDFFKDFGNEFPVIVYNDALTSKSDFSTEPTLTPQHIDEFDLKDETSLSECDEEEQNVLYFNDVFPFNVIYPDDSKSDKDKDDDKIDIKRSGDMSVKPLPDLINTDVGAYAHGVYTTYSLNEYNVFNTGTIRRMLGNGYGVLTSWPREININEYWWRIYEI